MTPTMNLYAGNITAGRNVGRVNCNNTIYSRDPRERRVKLANWISDFDFSQYQSEAYERYTQGTLRWVLNEPEFIAWLTDGGMLWAYGKPGAGKTTFASVVIKHLGSRTLEDPAVICYIYCRQVKIHSPLQLLAAILKQLILRCKKLDVDDLQNLKDQGRLPTMEKIVSKLKHIFSKLPNVSIVIDALECISNEKTRKQVLECLQSFTSVKVLITSRFIPSIQYAMDRVKTRDAMARVKKLTISAQDDDVITHFWHEAQSNSTLERLLSELSQKDEKEIIETIIQKADGMFLFAAHLINELAKETNPAGLLKALDKVPGEVIALYDQTLEQIRMQGSKGQRLAFHTCSWILEALRPLKVIEIRHALAIGSLDLDRMAEKYDLDDEVAVISSCAGLINVDTEGVCFFHHTVQEFLQDARIVDDFLSAMTIATTSLKVLSFPGVECDPPYPLTEYVASAWGPLVQRHESNETVYKLAVQQLAKTATISILSRTCVGPAFKFYSGDYEGRCGATAIHIIAVYGLVRICRKFITMGCINEKDNHGRTALTWSASNGHLELVEELLSHASIEIDVRDKKHGLTPLLTAAEKGHVHVVNFLLDHGKIKRPHAYGISSGRRPPLLVRLLQSLPATVPLLSRNQRSRKKEKKTFSRRLSFFSSTG